jgi:cytochrome c peroxidase
MQQALVFLLLVTIVGAEVIKSEWVRPHKIPSPKNNPLTKEKIALGQKLFFDPILSRANNISCMTCHNPLKGWSDRDSVAVGDKGMLGERNTPTILNSAYQHVYFWDGRAKSLEEQALGPIESHVEMNLDSKVAVEKLKTNLMYQTLFKKAFPKEGITTKTLAKALASFQRSIVSGKSRFDKYIKGDKAQLSSEEAEGFGIFVNKANCTVCHSGFNFSDQSFNKVGIANKDEGRGKIKKRAIWKNAFKTPTLRDIANTSPYFHDGSIEKLEDAVEFCARGPRDKNSTVSPILLDKNLNKRELSLIVQFLHSLSEPVD